VLVVYVEAEAAPEVVVVVEVVPEAPVVEVLDTFELVVVEVDVLELDTDVFSNK
jgi:hypothetical protein